MEIHPVMFVIALLLSYAAGMVLGWNLGKFYTRSKVYNLAKMVGGKVDWEARLPDGSGAATMSMPLPKGHWLLVEGYNEPPAPWRMGITNPNRKKIEERLREVAKYAIRASTMNGKEVDFDPDAMVGNFVVGAVGYHTVDGTSHADEGQKL